MTTLTTSLSKVFENFRDTVVGFFKNEFELNVDTNKGVFDMKVYVAPLNGRYGLFRKVDGQLIGTYARGRDARRGARRKGLQVSQ